MSGNTVHRVRLLVTAVAVAAAGLTGSALPTAADQGAPHLVRAVNIAIGASASASSAAANEPASNAVDGSASTAWCATGWTGSVVVDLGAPQVLSGLGVTSGATASASTASIDLAVTAGVWQPVAGARSIALNGNTPSYIPLPLGQTARYARLTVSTGDGAPACIGEFRTFADTDTPMMLGADLSFTRQELAAGTTFTDHGQTSSPIQILRVHGGNYVRMRLWVNPPTGTAIWPTTSPSRVRSGRRA